MRPIRFELDGYRSVIGVSFDVGMFTVLFGKNNAGKTNILEAMYGVLTGMPLDVRRPVSDRDHRLVGGLWVELEQRHPFDEKVANVTGLDSTAMGAGQFVKHVVRLGAEGVEVGDPYSTLGGDPDNYEDCVFDSVHGVATAYERPHVLFLDWEFEGLHDRFAECVAETATSSGTGWPWLDSVKSDDGSFQYHVPPSIEERTAQLAGLATDLLPDFVEGAIDASITSPLLWGDRPKVILDYHQRGATQCPDVVELAGSGAARWIAAAIQIAVYLFKREPGLTALRNASDTSGLIIILDEPEAHLHPSAVASVVRWCQRMARTGIMVLVASHHEEFLRSAGDDATFVHVVRDKNLIATTARTLSLTAPRDLLELAADVGVHPAVALSLHRAVLFVEGPLDVAVLDEYAGTELDSAGVLLVPIHGTKNLEGLISAEVVTRIGIKTGILTDASDFTTVSERSRRRQSSEEKKVQRVIEISREQGLPEPTPFGVPEADLLFALPKAGIEDYIGHDFPEWTDLVKQCRTDAGASPSESVNWKQYAQDNYGLPVTDPAGVRQVVRHLDLAGVTLPSIRRVVDEVIHWALTSPDERD